MNAIVAMLAAIQIGASADSADSEVADRFQHWQAVHGERFEEDFGRLPSVRL